MSIPRPEAMPRVFEERREQLRSIMQGEGLRALIVTLDANRYYLSGFELHDPQPDESAGFLLIQTRGRDYLFTDARFFDAARRWWDEESIVIYQGNPAECLNNVVSEQVGAARVGFDARHVSVDFFRQLAIPGLVRSDEIVESLREIKDEYEIAAMAESCALNERMMQWLPSRLQPGKTEAQIAWELEQFFRNNGAEELAFASIVAVDGNAALPHAQPGETPIADGCALLVDVGCRKHAYCSDQTRTFWVGEREDPFFTENLEKVRSAQEKAIRAIRPGLTGAEVFEVARASLEKDGVARFFTHGLGHGVGLQTHERPRLSPRETRRLAPGMVVTVEPGVYYSGRLGIRWEHMVVVTDEGCQVL